MTIKKTRKSSAPATEAQPNSDRTASTAATKAHSKAAAMIALLKRDGGATLDEMMEATGWQKHSVRGFMAGALKNRHGLTVTSVMTEQGRSYRLVDEAQS